MTEEKTITKTWITGFWRRIGAFVIDSIVLGIVGYVLGLFFSTWFVEIGVWGRLIGFTIALLYFGTLNSNIFNGQTLGKKLLKIKVVNSDNETIGILKSFARYSIIGIPFFLNGAKFSDEVLFSPFMYLLSFLIFGGMFGIIYLYVFNRNTRQSLHDVILGTYVVNIDTSNEDIQPMWKPHLVVVGILFIISGLIPVYTSNLAQEGSFQELLTAKTQVLKNNSIANIGIMYGSTSTYSSTSGTKETTYIQGQVFLKKNELLNEILALETAKIIAQSYTETMQKDIVYIIFIYGYDIGIAAQWNFQSYQFKPSELVESVETKI